MPDRNGDLIRLMDQMIAGEVPLSDDEWRLVVLTALRDLRSKYESVSDFIVGTPEKPGVVKRVEDLETVAVEWRTLKRRIEQVSPGLVAALILSFLGFLWGLLTHVITITVGGHVF